MFSTIIIGIAAVIAVISAAIGIALKKSDDRELRDAAPKFKTGAVLTIIIALIVTLFASTTIVPPRTVGVKVALGKPVGSVGNGFHFKAPWTSVEKMDASIQNDVYNGDKTITVRLGNNTEAEADASIRWQLKQDNIEQLFLDYKTFDNIRDNLVTRNFRAAMNEAFASYDPLATVESANNSDADKALPGIAEKVKDKLQDKLGDDIIIHDFRMVSGPTHTNVIFDAVVPFGFRLSDQTVEEKITIPLVNFDESTQNRINELQAETARTRIANQKQETADAEAKANKILEDSVTPEVLSSKCLDIADRNNKDVLGCIAGTTGQPIINKSE